MKFAQMLSCLDPKRLEKALDAWFDPDEGTMNAQKTHAIKTLAACGIPPGADFYALATDRLVDLSIHADAARYRAPDGAKGSRLRYFHTMLQRRAARGDS